MKKIPVKFLLISLFSLAPTMVHAGKTEGYLWAGAALGTGVGAAISALVTVASDMMRIDGKFGQALKKMHCEKAAKSDIDPVLQDYMRNGMLAPEIEEAFGKLGVLSGAAMTVALAPLSILSLYKAVKNFKDNG